MVLKPESLVLTLALRTWSSHEITAGLLSLQLYLKR